MAACSASFETRKDALLTMRVNIATSSPLSGDNSVVIKHGFAISPHVFARVLPGTSRPRIRGRRECRAPDAPDSRVCNCQISTAVAGQIVIAVDVDTTGSDRGLVRPMLDELQRCY